MSIRFRSSDRAGGSRLESIRIPSGSIIDLVKVSEVDCSGVSATNARPSVAGGTGSLLSRCGKRKPTLCSRYCP